MGSLKLGLVEFNWNFIIQIVNTILLAAIIYGIFYLLFKWPKKRRKQDERIDRLEKRVDELNKKLGER